jgi:cobalamin biosynthesis Mg chelatase CobN
MKFNNVLSGVNIILSSIKSYPKRRRVKGLYKQWAERSGLQPEVFYAEEAKAEDTRPQAVAAGISSGKTRESEQGYAQNSHSETISSESPTGKDSRARTYDNIGTYVDSIEHEEPRKVAMFMMAEINKEQLRLPILLMLLGAAIVIFLLGVVLLFLHSFAI